MSGNRGYRVVRKGRLLCFIVILIIIGIAVFINSAFFDISKDSITVEGDGRFHKEDIIASASESLFKINIFKLDEPAVIEKIEKANAYLKVEDILRELPNKVTIKISERESIMQISFDGASYDLAENFVVMSDARSTDPALVQIIGVKTEAPVKGTPLVFVSEQAKKDLNEIVNNLKNYGMENVSKISLKESEQVYVVLKNGFKVILGLPTKLSVKLSYLKPAIESVIANGHTKGVLDLSVVTGEGQEGKIYFTEENDEGNG